MQMDLLCKRCGVKGGLLTSCEDRERDDVASHRVAHGATVW